MHALRMNTPRSLTWDAVRLFRWRLSGLDEAGWSSDIPALVARVCGVQAQVLSSALLAVALRTPQETVTTVARTLEQGGGLVKTFGPRGTIHLVPASELALWMSVQRAVHQLPAEPDELARAIAHALDGRCLERRELAAAVGARLGEDVARKLRSAWGSLLRPAAYHGLLCYGPTSGSKVTFVRADQWVEGWEPMPPTLALRQAVRKYIRAYGPTQAKAISHWLQLPRDRAQAVLDDLAPELEEVRIGRTRGWMMPEDAESVGRQPATSPVALVPRYDIYLLNGQPRNQLIPKNASRIRDYRWGRYEGAVGVPLLISNGWVSGMWEWTDDGGLRVEVFDADKGTAGIDAAAQRTLACAERSGEIVYGRLES